MTLRRGFKSEAEALSVSLRADLALGPSEPLSPWHLAEDLHVPIERLSDYNSVAQAAANFFQRDGLESFSAVTVFRGPRRIIVHNDAHSVARQASNVMHELSHALLFHQPSRAIGDDGTRLWDSQVEEEASWLSGVLLVPRPATLLVVKGGLSVQEAAQRFGVSESMMQYRIGVTGVKRQLRDV